MSVNFGGFTLHRHKVLLLQSGEEKKLDSCAHQVAFEWSPIELSWVSLTQIIQVSLVKVRGTILFMDQNAPELRSGSGLHFEALGTS